MSQRPERPRVLDELGQPKTLAAGPGDFRTLCPGRPGGPGTVFLGLGPEPGRLAELFPDAGTARYVECPDLAAQFGGPWRESIPAGLAPCSPDDVPALAREGARLVLYAPGPRLFPSFWGPVLAAAQLALLASAPFPRPRLAWLPGDDTGLLRVELAEALESLGFSVRRQGCASMDAMRTLLAAGECPELFLSVNFSGLDPLGEAAHLLAAAGARVSVWCVDNPLHLISGLKSRFWTGLPLFVTDGWFMEPLQRLGARQVRHMPLAARIRDLAAPPRRPGQAFADLSDRLVFVGRSAFPGRDGFFAGCALPPAPWAEAQAMLQRGERPDFGWWLDRLGVTRLWPGPDVRQAGFCAEETGRSWRTLCLSRAQADLDGRLTVFGDDGWRQLLPPGTDLRGPVDYYAALPDITASAACCLALTSPLLPRGLSQRHFDVFAWGGLLASDATPGLELFPAELTREITFRAPDELVERFRLLVGDARLRANLSDAWRAELTRAHTYAHRLAELLGNLATREI